MKKIILVLLLLGFFKGNMHAQAKQQRMLLQQIAALQVYIGYAQKGYSAVKKGLNTVGDLKRGEFNLHTDYLNSLKAVNPKVKKYARVAEIIALQLKITKSYKSLYQQIRQDDLFYGDEVDYIKRVFERVLENCDANLDELLNIVTDGKLEMKDNERITRINIIYQNMLDNYTFSESFSNQTKLMALSKAMELKEAKTSRDLRGIN
jgi:phage host-nuclease inhibitor protein Gam